MITFPTSRLSRLFAAICLTLTILTASAAERPWTHGPLKVSANNRFLCHSDGSLLYIGTHSGSHLTIGPRKIPGAPPFLTLPYRPLSMS